MRLVREACHKQNIQPDQLTIHADRGAVPTAADLADLYKALGIERSHSRPHVSDDNPYSEAHFKTVKYAPDYPDRFASYDDAHAYCVRFMDFYIHEHRHSGIAFMTPADVHYGRTDAVLAARIATLDAAYAAHPERFVHGRPTPQRPPEVVYINPPIVRDDAAGDVPNVHVLADRSSSDAPAAPPTRSRSINCAKLNLH